jgi:hypothetical protein
MGNPVGFIWLEGMEIFWFVVGIWAACAAIFTGVLVVGAAIRYLPSRDEKGGYQPDDYGRRMTPPGEE